MSATDVIEGGTSTLTARISDQGDLNAFTLEINWGDGSPIESFPCAAGTTEFTATHPYLDDDPSGTSSDSYTIQVTLTDDNLDTDSATTDVTVDNAAPILMHVTANTLLAGETTTLAGEIVDAGIHDAFILNVDWGDGSLVETFNYPAGTTSFSETHLFAAGGNDPYTINLQLQDDDLGTATKRIRGAYLDGTTGNDTIVVRPGVVGASLHRVDVNGTLTTYDPATYDAIYIDALDGSDMITIVGTGSLETASLSTSSVNMFGPAYELNATSVETIYIYGATGDTANLTGDAAGSNTFKGRPTYSELQGTGYYHYVSGFDTVTATPGGGSNNRALLYGSAGADVLTASAASAVIYWDGVPSATATGFNEVLAFGASGDTANLTGNGAGGNTLYGRPAYTELKSPAFYLYAGGFEAVTATPGGGINNRALLYGGTGADTFTAMPTSAVMDLAGAPSITATGFNMMLGIGGSGDTANLTGDSAGDNFLQSRLAYTNMSGASYYYLASGFQTVTAASGGGSNNRAFFYNDPAASSLTADPTTATMDWNGTSSATAANFDRIFGFGSTGDTATFTGNSAGNNTFEGRPDYNALTGAGYYHYANGFDSVNATAGGGTNNRAFLYGGAGADTLSAGPTTGTMTWNSGRVAQMSGFDKVFGYGSTGDTANLSGDATATNTFDGYSTYSTLYSAAFYHYVSGFDLVTAMAGSATNDRANLYDSVLNDLFTSSPASGQMDYGDDGSTDISVLAFERIHARFLSGGNDDANLTDSAAVDQYIGTGANGQLTDAASYWLYLYFDSLGTDRVTLNSSDTGNTVDADSLDYVLNYDPAYWTEI